MYETKGITVLMAEPDKSPKTTTLTNTLDDLQKAVSIGALAQLHSRLLRVHPLQ